MKKMKKKLVWEELPESSTGRSGYWFEVGGALKKRPLRWACVDTKSNPNSANSCAFALRSRRLRLPLGKFEFRVRGNKIYGRYLGK